MRNIVVSFKIRGESVLFLFQCAQNAVPRTKDVLLYRTFLLGQLFFLDRRSISHQT